MSTTHPQGCDPCGWLLFGMCGRPSQPLTRLVMHPARPGQHILSQTDTVREGGWRASAGTAQCNLYTDHTEARRALAALRRSSAVIRARVGVRSAGQIHSGQSTATTGVRCSGAPSLKLSRFRPSVTSRTFRISRSALEQYRTNLSGISTATVRPAGRAQSNTVSALGSMVMCGINAGMASLATE